MTGSYQYLESTMPVNSRNLPEGPVIEASGTGYRELNGIIRKLAREGERKIVVKGVRGQRYLGTGLDYPDLYLQVHGVPGEDLGFNLNGPSIEVFGHCQNAAANTMDSGTIVVHGMAGDALAYGMRGGKLFIRDDAGYRVGIHMKEYGEKSPAVVIGGTAGDYLGEYMAGGVIVLLNRNNAGEMVAGNSDRTLATGIHGGEIYIFNYDIPSFLPGIGARLKGAGSGDREKIKPLVEDFCRYFNLDEASLLQRDLVKIVPEGSRPFARFYYPSYPVHTGLQPEHRERTSPCEASCPAGVPTGRFLKYLRSGEIEKAMALLDEVTPLRYSCCGFICPHLCMSGCTRGNVDFPIRTPELARKYKSESKLKAREERTEKIAVIGAGPAGLSSAYQLNLRGYRVTVYDESDRPGGKMYQVISRSRLPLEDLERDLGRISDLGVRFVLKTRVDKEKFNRILNDYDYTVVAVGAHRPLLPPVKGMDYLTPGIDFLKRYNSGSTGCPIAGPPGNAVIVGGGDAALDGIEALLQLGFEPGRITVIDVKKPSADIRERRKLEQQGVMFRYPLFLDEAGEEGVTVRDALGNKEIIPAGLVLVFINEQPGLDFLPAGLQKERDPRGFYLHGRNESFRTSHPRISVVGDAQGLGLVTHNIGRGRECALEVDALLRGVEYVPEHREAPESNKRQVLMALPLREEEAGLDEEHERCLHCGICVQCDRCVEACPREALTRDGENFTVDLSRCGGCGTCASTCPGDVIRMVRRDR